jgi:hypothetical protein
MADSKVTTVVKTFKTTTQELMVLSSWLSAEGATHIAMEATGVYWKPVWHILSDGEFELILANAAHVKNVPGRKTDVNDATWLADLMAHGLIRASFVPDEPTQQMRDLLRTRKQIVRERSSHVQRIQKTLEDANIKLDSVVTDILGLSGRRISTPPGTKRAPKSSIIAWINSLCSPGLRLIFLPGAIFTGIRFCLRSWAYRAASVCRFATYAVRLSCHFFVSKLLNRASADGSI